VDKIEKNFLLTFENGKQFYADTLVRTFALVNLLKNLEMFKNLTFRIENVKVHRHERSKLYDRSNEVSQTL